MTSSFSVLRLVDKFIFCDFDISLPFFINKFNFDTQICITTSFDNKFCETPPACEWRQTIVPVKESDREKRLIIVKRE